MSKENESITKNLPTNKSPWADGFPDKFYQTFKKKLMLIIHKLFQKIQDEWILPNSVYKAHITLIPKTDRNTTKKGSYRPKSLMNVDRKLSMKKKSEFNDTLEESNHDSTEFGIYAWDTRMVQHSNSINWLGHIDHLNRYRKDLQS
jgi:hypothetical protein